MDGDRLFDRSVLGRLGPGDYRNANQRADRDGKNDDQKIKYA